MDDRKFLPVILHFIFRCVSFNTNTNFLRFVENNFYLSISGNESVFGKQKKISYTDDFPMYGKVLFSTKSDECIAESERERVICLEFT